MERNYKIFFRTLEDNYRTLDINDKFDTVINISRDENNFELFKGYEGNDDGLINLSPIFFGGIMSLCQMASLELITLDIITTLMHQR